MSKFGWRRGNPSTFIPVGDVGEATKWLPYARVQLEVMMNNLVAAPTDLQPYRRRTYRPADGVTITLESLHGIPRITIETGGYDYITVSWHTQELHAGYFGLDNTSKKILDFPFRGPDGSTIVGPNLLNIGGDQFATGPAGDAGQFPAEQVAIVSVLGTKASVKYLPRWRSAGDQERIVSLHYGGRTVEGVKRIEYLSTHNISTIDYFNQTNVFSIFDTAQTSSPAYSSTTPLGSSLTVVGGDVLVTEATANQIPFSPVSRSPGRPWMDSDLFPGRTWWFGWNYRNSLTLDITASVETDVYEGRTLYTTVFTIDFKESVIMSNMTFLLGISGLALKSGAPFVPTVDAFAAASATPGLMDYVLSSEFAQPFWFEDWLAGGMVGGSSSYSKHTQVAMPGVGLDYAILSAADMQSIAATTLGAGKIAILVLTYRAGLSPQITYGNPPRTQAAVWPDVGGYATGGTYLNNMITITSADNGLSWVATVTRREVEPVWGGPVFPDYAFEISQPNTVQFFNTLLYIGGDTVLAFGRTNAGGTVYRSTDAGISYTLAAAPGSFPVTPVANMAICLAPGVAAFFRAGKFYRSIDSGTTWSTYTVSVMTAPWHTFEARIEIRAIGETYATTKLAIAVSTSGAPSTSKIFLSDDGGATWRIDSTIGKKPYPQDQAIGINIGALRTGLPPTPGLPGIYDTPSPE